MWRQHSSEVVKMSVKLSQPTTTTSILLVSEPPQLYQALLHFFAQPRGTRVWLQPRTSLLPLWNHCPWVATNCSLLSLVMTQDGGPMTCHISVVCSHSLSKARSFLSILIMFLKWHYLTWCCCSCQPTSVAACHEASPAERPSGTLSLQTKHRSAKLNRV